MELDALGELSREDQATFLLGRIAREAVRMDAALRTARATLMNAPHDDATLFGGPDNLSAAAAECDRLLQAQTDYPEAIRQAGADTFGAARAAYNERSRYLHDLLTADVPDEPPGAEIESIPERREWKRVRLTRPKGRETMDARVGLDHLRQLVTDLIVATWRVRALSLTLDAIKSQAPGTADDLGDWFTVLSGDFRTTWDGSTVLWSGN